MQRHILYLGEINDTQQAAWTKVIDVFETVKQKTAELALYPADRTIPPHAAEYGVQVRLSEFSLHRPRQWGACWVACRLWEQLDLDQFWSQRLPPSREGTDWRGILQTLTIYRLLDPGSEWRLHREWFQKSALADLLEADFELAEKDNLYRCLDKLLEHRQALFQHLRQRWQDLFGIRFDVLLYDLTSDLSPERVADRGAPLCGLSGLLFTRELASGVTTAGPWPDRTIGLRQIRSDADDRCAFSHHRWQDLDLPPLHPTRKGSEALAGAAGMGITRATAATNHSQWPNEPRLIGQPVLVQTF